MDNTLIQIFAVSALLGAALLQAILAIAGFRSRAERSQREQSLRALQDALMTIRGENMALGRRLSVVEHHMTQVFTLPEKHNQAAPVGQAYEVAVNLVRKGSEVEELIATCGLSLGEAELIKRLYGTPAASDVKTASQLKRRAAPAHTAAAAYETSY